MRPSHLAHPGEDGGNEFRVRMASAAKVSDNGADIERHSALHHGQLIAAIVQEEPVRHAAGARQPRATGIESADAADEAIGRSVRMTADDAISTTAGQQLPELLTGDARLDPRAVVCSRRRVDAQQERLAPERQAQLRRYRWCTPVPSSPVRVPPSKRHQWSIDAAPATSMEH
jgi:hypothetical protein